MATTVPAPFSLIILFILVNSIPIPSFSCPLHQKQALLDFKSNVTTFFNISSSDPNHPLRSWSPNADCCSSFRNVSCSITGTVTKLDLNGIMRSYEHPTSPFFEILTPLFRIRSLEKLDISYNQLVGEISGGGFANLTELHYLDMRGNELSGSIPNQIFGLTNLRYLDMSFNSLVGNIPEEIENLTQLRVLYLQDNRFSGGILSSIANMMELKLLDLSENSFSSQIPATIGRLPNLAVLVLHNNQFMGPIPSSIQNLSKLQTLELQKNKFTGEIPIGLFRIAALECLFIGDAQNKFIWNNQVKIDPMCSLVELSMPSCGISGQIPEWISSQKRLTLLDLSGNQLEGRFPNWLAEMDIENVVLFDNNLTGSIPHRVFESTNLKILHLSKNNFFGELPKNIGSAKAMIAMLLSRNNFFGKIPTSMSNMHNLQLLDLSRNKFSGDTFPVLSNNSDFFYLDLSYNEFSGKIPTTFSIETQVLYLGRNKFSGNLPRNLSKFVNLRYLDLHDNDITGYFQDVLPKSPYLEVLILRNNSFEGFIPTTISDFTNLRILDLSKNNLTGSIPPEIANLTGMIKTPVPMSTSGGNFPNDTRFHFTNAVHIRIEDLIVNWKNSFQGLSSDNLGIYSLLDLSNNGISGEIPASLGSLESLKLLNVSSNNIFGCIPVSLGNLKEIETLDLSHNNISGSIPQSLAKLGELAILDVSNNKLTGKIPRGRQMDTMNELNYFANNSGLCGMQINITCPEDISPLQRRGEDGEKQSSSFWHGTWVGFPIGFVLSILIMGYSLNFLRLFKLR